jgi:uncharacterized protein Smg (DUF494 family)
MYQRIMEILVFLMDEIGSETWKVEEMDQLSEDLIQRGYTEQEINTAFYWLNHRLSWNNDTPAHKININQPAETSSRVLHSLEQQYLEPKAYGYLLQLRHLNLITTSEMEEVVERLVILEYRSASIDDVKAMVQSLLFEEGNFWTGSLRSMGLNDKGETYH